MKRRSSYPVTRRRFAWVAIATVLAMLLNLGQGILPGTTAPTASAHNLQTRDVYAYFDPDTQAMLDARIASPGWTPISIKLTGRWRLTPCFLSLAGGL